jgi:ABC-type multidrug transport system ATPase subunit
MSEELLKAIIRLFAIVAKERITEDERANIHEFLSLHANQGSVAHYLNLFDHYSKEDQKTESEDNLEDVDDETLEFIEEWAKILEITKSVNSALTKQQKIVLIIKIIELVYADRNISERQGNLIFHIGEALKIEAKDIGLLKRFVMGEELEELSAPEVLIIDDGSGAYPKGSLHKDAPNLTGLIAILRIGDIESYFIKYLGISTLTLNGQPLRSRRISVLPTGSTIRGKKIQTIYYSFIVTAYLHHGTNPQISFEAQHLFYHFKNGKLGLQNVSIAEDGGKLVGLMGASGSGKSTLLNVLNGTESPSSGRVYINGVNIHTQKHHIEGVIGYVPQDDLLIEELSVFQNLYYAAKLAFGKYTKSQLQELVETVLSNLGLQETGDLKVGSAMEKTISGGQRKRLNIGLELLREPAVLFVDEPTSGLSSRDSENIMDLLKELSLRGKMVFVVIHQPSSDIFKMFDSLLILDKGGHQIYYGNPVEAVVYFKNIIDAVNKTESTCPECGNINPEQIFNIIESRLVDEYGKLTDTRKVSASQWYSYFKKQIELPKIEPIKEKIKVKQFIPSWFMQARVFLTRDILSKLSNRQYLFINLLEAPVLAVFIAFLVRFYASAEGGGYSFFANDNIPIYFFMSIIVSLFMGLTVSAEEIFRDRKILKREQFLNLSRSGYLISKMLVLFFISAIQTGSFVLIGHFILEISGMGWTAWMVLFSVSCFANMMGLNISSTFNSAVTIYILIPLLLIPQLLLSGVVISFDKFNPSVSAVDGVPVIGDLMVSRWGFEAIMVSQFKSNNYNKLFYDVDEKISNAAYKKLYLIPHLESKLAFCINNLSQKRTSKKDEFISALGILQQEITRELAIVGEDKYKRIDRLTIQRFDSTQYQNTVKFLSSLKKYYVNIYNKAGGEKDKLLSTFTATPEGIEQLKLLKSAHHNKSIEDVVTNRGTAARLIEVNNQVIRKIDPIYYMEDDAEHIFDFKTKFFSPVKHIYGQPHDTLNFNLAVIWTFSIILYFTLYIDLLKRSLSLFDRQKGRFGKK